MKRVEASHVAALPQVSDYEEIAEILRSRKFAQGAYGENRAAFMADTLPTLDGERHMARRRVFAQLFRDESIAAYRDTHVTPAIDLCFEELRSGSHGAGEVRCDLVVLAQRCLYRVAAAITGIDGLESTAAADRFIGYIKDIAGGLTLDWTKEDPGVVARRATEARAAFRRDFFDPSYARRLAARDDAATKGKFRDALMLMLSHQHEAWPADPEGLLREVTLLLTAATQSTAASLVLLILRLERWLAAHPADREVLAKDPEFLRRAAMESLRLTQAAPARIRMALEDVTLASGRVIKAGEKVALLLVASNSDESKFGSHADAFDPHRVAAAGAAPWGHAFGGGAHTCLGRPLVTGSRLPGQVAVDGVLATLARRLYDAGIRLDESRSPTADTSTFYDVYSSVPIVLTRLEA
jgi:cytochrome P450